MLSHNKLLFARGVDANDEPFAWVYVGSANVSEAAWGGQKVGKGGGLGGLNVRNWECGVVVRVEGGKVRGKAGSVVGQGEGERKVPDMSLFEDTIEVPFVVPGEEYGERGPWFFREDGRT